MSSPSSPRTKNPELGMTLSPTRPERPEALRSTGRLFEERGTFRITLRNGTEIELSYANKEAKEAYELLFYEHLEAIHNYESISGNLAILALENGALKSKISDLEAQIKTLSQPRNRVDTQSFSKLKKALYFTALLTTQAAAGAFGACAAMGMTPTDMINALTRPFLGSREECAHNNRNTFGGCD